MCIHKYPRVHLHAHVSSTSKILGIQYSGNSWCLSVCACLCACAYIPPYICMCVCKIYLRTYTHIEAYMRVYAHKYVHVCGCVYCAGTCKGAALVITCTGTGTTISKIRIFVYSACKHKAHMYRSVLRMHTRRKKSDAHILTNHHSPHTTAVHYIHHDCTRKKPSRKIQHTRLF
jgi:hypothetical protein